MTAHLNSDLLRTFLAIHEAGSVTGGAGRIGRSQSATSLQIRQLEDIVGKPLFERHGRGVALTAAGEALRPTALQVVRSLDQALGALRSDGLTGRLKIGMPEEHGRASLAKIIADFAALHPRVELDVHCARGTGFDTALASGALDLAVFEVPQPQPGQDVLREDALIWVGSRDLKTEPGEPLPVALFDRTCWWRDLALSSLEEAGCNFRIVFTSENAVGVRAAIQSGIAVGLLHASEELQGLEQVAGLETRHPTWLVLQTAPGKTEPACEAMCKAVRRAFLR
ncbi:MAG: LysR substrate-binding domain-containing protein [Pseudomonadota bacterium]